MSAKAGLFVVLALFGAGYLIVWLTSVLTSRRRGGESSVGPVEPPTPFETLVGFVTNFFDTLGIGSFAPTTSIFKLRAMVPDERIPGTLNVGHTIPSIMEAFVFIAIVEVDVKTLALLVGASVVGAWLGAGIVASWPRRNVQIGMGLALVVAATLFTMTNLGRFPGGGDALELHGARLAIGVVGNLALGAFMTLGIGLYGPCMILVSLLGMNPRTAFPIMTGSCAFLMPVGSARFIRKESYRFRPALGLMLGGIPGVLFAAYVVHQLPLTAVRWLVVIVVLYTAGSMLRSAWRERQPAPAPPEPAPAP
jgi:uncharacterized membrane protein YfcA